MLACGRDSIVERAGNRGFDHWILRNVAVLRAIERFLDIGPVRTDMDCAVMLRPDTFARQAREIRHLGERQIDFATCAGVIEMAHRFHKIWRKLFAVHEPQECDIRINT